MVGALGTYINVKCTKYRHHHIPGHSWKNLIDVGVITFLAATSWFTIPFIFGCRPLAAHCYAEEEMEQRCRTLMCNEGYYSDIGSVTFGGSETISKILFDRSVLIPDDFSVLPLLVFGLAYFLLISVVYGANAPGTQNTKSKKIEKK